MHVVTRVCNGGTVSFDEFKPTLIHYLQIAREALLWKLDGASEYDVRRPLTPSGTNLLGVVKHVASVEAGYLGDAFGRPFVEPLDWFDEDAEPNADMWTTADQSREDVVALYHRVWSHSDATVAALPLDATGEIPWWPPERRVVTLHLILVHVIAETNRHAGHLDIVRELIDGAVGLRADNSNVPEHETQWWQDYRARLEATARTFAE